MEPNNGRKLRSFEKKNKKKTHTAKNILWHLRRESSSFRRQPHSGRSAKLIEEQWIKGGRKKQQQKLNSNRRTAAQQKNI